MYHCEVTATCVLYNVLYLSKRFKLPHYHSLVSSSQMKPNTWTCLTRCVHTEATCSKQHMIFMRTSQNTYLRSSVRGSILQLFNSSQVHCQPIKFLRSNCVFDAFPSECPWNGDFHNKSVCENVSPVYSLWVKMWKCVSPLSSQAGSQGPKQANLTAHTWACWTSSQNVEF